MIRLWVITMHASRCSPVTSAYWRGALQGVMPLVLELDRRGPRVMEDSQVMEGSRGPLTILGVAILEVAATEEEAVEEEAVVHR